MDPVLSSTVEFDEYIKSNLSRTKVLSSRTGRDSANLNLKHGAPGVSASNISKDPQNRQRAGSGSNNESKELSQDFLKLNINKYHQAVPQRMPSTQNSSAVHPNRDNHEDEVPRIALKHSWKTYVTAPSKTATTGAAANSPQNRPATAGARAQSKISYDDDWDLAWDNLQPPSPVSESRTETRRPQSAGTVNGLGKVTSSSTTKSTAGRPHTVLDDSVDFSAYKVRLVVLKRCFASWISYSEQSVENLVRKCKDVAENRVYWPKHSCFTWWNMLCMAVQQMKMYSKVRALRRLILERKKCRRFRTTMRKAAYHDKFTQFERFMVAMRRLGMKRRRRKLRQGREILAHNFRNLHLARMVVVAWKTAVAKTKSERLLNEEQTLRKDKIASFMKRVQSAPAPAGASSGAGPTSRATSRGRSNAKSIPRSVGSSGPSNKDTDRRNGGTSPPPSSSSSGLSNRQDKSAPLSPKKSVRHPGSPVPAPSHTAGAKFSDRYNAGDYKFSESIEGELVRPQVDFGDNYEGEDFEDEGDEPPPPSYDALMRSSHASAQSPTLSQASRSLVGAEDFSNIRLSGGDRGLPPLPPMAKHNDRNGAAIERGALTSRSGSTAGANRRPGGAKEVDFPHTSRSVPAGTVGVAEATHGTLEERAAARRQRTLLLKKQAEERIQEKQQQKLALERQKHEREVEAAETMRKEARAKLLQTKQLTERSRAEQTDQLRELLLKARKFRHTQLLIRCGIAPWQQYMEMLRLDELKAVHFRNDRLLLSAWTALLGYIIALRTERYRREHRLTAVATAHYRRKILKAVWRMLRMHHRVILAKTKAVTGHFSRFTLCRRSFHAWRVAYERSVRLTVRQYRSVQPRGDLSLQRHYWRLWCAFHAAQLEEREIRQRVNSKWAAVQGWMNKPV